MPNVLLIGGAGFIGTNITKMLLGRSYNIFVLDNGANSLISRVPPEAALIHEDCRTFDYSRLPKMDYVIYLATIHHRLAAKWPILDAETTIAGTVRALEAFKGVPFLYLSSGIVYGSNSSLRGSIESDPLVLDEPYAVGKAAAEWYVRLAASHSPTTIFRFGFVYGPNQTDAAPHCGVLASFLCKGLRGEAVTLFGDGTQMTDYTYISDVLRAVDYWLETPPNYQIFNVSYGMPRTLNDVIKCIQQYVPLNVTTAPPAPGIACCWLDCDKIRHTWGWKATMPLEAGIEATFNWLRKR